MELEMAVENETGETELDLTANELDEGTEMGITVNDADPRLTGDDDGVRIGVAEDTAAEELSRVEEPTKAEELTTALVDEARAAGDEEDNAADEATTALDSTPGRELDGVLLGVATTLGRAEELATGVKLGVDVVHTSLVERGNWKLSKSNVKKDPEQPQTNNRACVEAVGWYEIV